MSKQRTPRYTERFTISYNRGPIRVTQEMEIVIDLATIRRVMGLRACYSMGRKSQKTHISVICLGQPRPGKNSESRMQEVEVE